jgi:hypothetical protein
MLLRRRMRGEFVCRIDLDDGELRIPSFQHSDEDGFGCGRGMFDERIEDDGFESNYFVAYAMGYFEIVIAVKRVDFVVAE